MAAALIPYFGIKIISPAKITANANSDPVIFTLIWFFPVRHATTRRADRDRDTATASTVRRRRR
jgi:hypothetical protein